MASQGYRDWVRAGRPYTLIRPARAVQAALLRHGITVWDFPDEGHQKAEPPEDHTPYSATGFPGQNARWMARGLDIMPRSDSWAHRKENADIARQLIRDRDAGVPGAMWIKYINWTDEDGACRQERWTTVGAPLRRTTRSSTDSGHVHVSGRSDADNDARADGYDPFARMTGADDDMNLGDRITIPLYEAPDGVPLPTGPETLDVATILGGAHRRAYIAMHLAQQARDEARAASVADAQRDQAAIAAIQALTKVIQAGGGTVDTVPILAEIRAVREATHAEVVQLQQALAESEAQRLALQQRLAAALAPPAA
ncbi:hypothetical protein ACQEVZ_20325 [Dactylosporangium sp. CA-152071]|uniref:hypothetical protein n=1 Tax=Dactylosporangium sp. CA-152071 TaxID=3239933 RepID=UPI003D90C08B